MKRLIVPGVVLTFALAMVSIGNAQSQAQSQSSDQMATQSSAKSHSMTGCLAAGTEPGTYMLNEVQGGSAKTVGIVSSSADLAAHVGHKVEVTGTQVDNATAEKDYKSLKADHYMKVTKVKMISTSCS